MSSKYLTFALNSQHYGVPIEAVREINQMCEVVPVPQSSAFMAGVINLRGKVIPVLNLRTRLGMDFAQSTQETCIVVIQARAGYVGMIVDSVDEVVELTDEQIEPAPSVGKNADDAFVKGIAKTQQRLYILLDLVRLVDGDSAEGDFQAAA